MTRAAMSGVAIVGAWIAMLPGCGRLGFEPVAQVSDGGGEVCNEASGHDEDGDGIDDACDLCPHVADALGADRDGDGVGDACDPNPDAAGERILFFDPFTALQADWSVLASEPGFDGESLFADTRDAAITLALEIVPAKDRLELGLRLAAGDPIDTQQVIISVHDSPNYYYCELYSLDASAKLGLTYKLGQDGAVGVATGALAEGVQNQQGFLRLDNASPRFACETTWPAEPSRLEGDIPPEVVASSLRLTSQGLETWFDYFIIIRSE